MKICLINNLYRPYSRGGAEIIFDNIAEEIERKGHQAFIITSKSISSPIKNIDKKNKIYRLRSCNIVSYKNLSKLPKLLRLLWHLIDMFDVCNYWRVKSILKKEKPDLVMTHNLKGVGYLVPRAIKKIGVKHIHTLHDIQLIHPSGLMIFGKEKIIESFFSKTYSYICRTLFGSPDIIVSPSKWLLDLHTNRNFFSKSKKIIIPNSIKIYQDLIKTKEKYSVFKFIYVGLIDKQKGIDVMLKAFQRLCHKYLTPKCQLDLIGAGACLKKYTKLYKNEKNINFLGLLNNKETLKNIAKANALIVPSICYENSPTVIYEATATKTPIIASRIGGITELINNLGGLLFKPNNEGDLMYQMKWLMNNYNYYYKKLQKKENKLDEISIKNYVNKILKI